MKQNIPVLTVLSDRERTSFFSGANGRRLAQYSPQAEWVYPPESRTDWHTLLLERKPKVIVGAWSLPKLDREILDSCPALEYLCYVNGSLRHKADIHFWERGGIASNWGSLPSHNVAECAFTLVLGSLRRAAKFCHEMHVERSYRPRGKDLSPQGLFRKKVGIHGFGHIAKQFIRLVEPFDVDIEVWSEPVPDAVFAANSVRKAGSLRELFANNDVIVEVEALTPESERSVNREVIAAMKPGTVFVNVGRGAVVDEQALAERVARDEIYVGLDVYQQEPLPEDSLLLGQKNALLLPHMAGKITDTYPEYGKSALDNLEAWLRGEMPPQVQTKETVLRST